jgi:hypothetical protein
MEERLGLHLNGETAKILIIGPIFGEDAQKLDHHGQGRKKHDAADDERDEG